MSTFKKFVWQGIKNAALIDAEVKPLPANYVRCKILAASVNPMDGKMLSFGNIFQLPVPFGLGFDFSGLVIESNSPDYAVNDRVLGTSFSGCFSEQLSVSANAISKYDPTILPDVDAATFGIAYRSAWKPLLVTADLKSRKGQWIFIPGGAGGVGHFAVQLAKHYGLKVIASASKPAGLDYLKSLGIAGVIDYKKQNVEEEIFKLAGPEGVDVVFESTYVSSSARQSVSVLKAGGLFVRLGPWEHGTPEDKEFIQRVAAERCATATFGALKEATNPTEPQRVAELNDMFQDAVELNKQGAIKPWVTRVVPFEFERVLEVIYDSVATSQPGKTVVQVLKQ